MPGILFSRSPLHWQPQPITGADPDDSRQADQKDRMDFFECQYGHQKEDGQGDVKAHAAQSACGEALGEENGLSHGENGSADEADDSGL